MHLATKVPCFHLCCWRWGRHFHAGGHAHTSFIHERRCQSKGSSFINQLSVVQVPTRLVCLKVCAFLLTLLMMHCRTMLKKHNIHYIPPPFRPTRDSICPYRNKEINSINLCSLFRPIVSPMPANLIFRKRLLIIVDVDCD